MRDYKLDFLRGAALMMIFCDHVPGHPISDFTLHAVAFSGGAEFFFFLSGLVAGRAYVRSTQEKGWNEILPKILRRTWSLYLATVGIAFATFLFLAAAHYLTGERAILSETRMGSLYDDPAAYLPHLFALTFQGRNLDILPLYVVFFLAQPLILVLAKRHIFLALVPSFLLYVCVLLWDWHFTTAPRGAPWFFNPLSWQFLFVLGIALGWIGRERFERIATDARVVTGALAAAVSLCVLEIVTQTDLIVLPWLTETNLTDKPNLGPVRVVNFLALFVLLLRFLPSGETMMQKPLLRGIVYTGQHSLTIFMAGVLYCALGHVIREALTPGAFVMTLFMLAGVAMHPVLGSWLNQRQEMARLKMAAA